MIDLPLFGSPAEKINFSAWGVVALLFSCCPVTRRPVDLFLEKGLLRLNLKLLSSTIRAIPIQREAFRGPTRAALAIGNKIIRFW